MKMPLCGKVKAILNRIYSFLSAQLANVALGKALVNSSKIPKDENFALLKVLGPSLGDLIA